MEIGSIGDSLTWAIIGVGVNLYQSSFSEKLKDSATSLALEGVHIPRISDFSEGLTQHIIQVFRSAEHGLTEEIRNQYESEQQ